MPIHLQELTDTYLTEYEAVFIGKEVKAVSRLPTGILQLDAILLGGLPRKHLTEVYGMTSSGRTSLALQLIKETQRQGHTCLYIDTEHSFDASYAEKIGINTSNLLVHFPLIADQIVSTIPEIVKDAHIDLVIIDTICGALPKSELERDLDKSNRSVAGPFWVQEVPKLLLAARKHDFGLVVINQVRDHIGTTSKIPTNIASIASNASLQLQLSSVKTITNEGINLGQRILVDIKKNLLGPKIEKAEVDLFYGTGFSVESNLIEMAIVYGVLERRGSWFAFNRNNIAQGKPALIKLLRDDPDLFQSLYDTCSLFYKY